MNDLIFSRQNLFITFLASLLIWFLFASVLFLWVVKKKIKKDDAIRAIIGAFLAWAISEGIKLIVTVPRPFEVTGYSPLTATVPGTNSFPSTHSAMAFALAVSLYLKNKSIGAYFFIGALFVAAGRIFSNVHYVFDVVIGSWVGIVSGFVASKIFSKAK